MDLSIFVVADALAIQSTNNLSLLLSTYSVSNNQCQTQALVSLS